ncbi:hypothetical protein M2275_003143 [Rhodococcus opacus]|nr:hypothetical protein [Rhodococcus opacus]
MSEPIRDDLCCQDHCGIVDMRSEFATVQVSVDRTANGPRLRIVDTRRRTEILLDPLELEALTRLDHDQLRELIDPSEWGKG